MGTVILWLSLTAFLSTAVWILASLRKQWVQADRAPRLDLSWRWLVGWFAGLEITYAAGGKWAFLVLAAASSIWLGRRFQLDWTARWGWKAQPFSQVIFCGCWWGLALAWPQQLVSWVNTLGCEWMGWPVEMSPLLRRLLESTNVWEIAGIVVLICGVAPVVEELIYRSFLWSRLRENVSAGWATAISALVFAALHWQVASFLPHLLAGWVLAEIWRRTGSLPLCIVVHGTVNAVTVGALLAGKT